MLRLPRTVIYPFGYTLLVYSILLLLLPILILILLIISISISIILILIPILPISLLTLLCRRSPI